MAIELPTAALRRGRPRIQGSLRGDHPVPLRQAPRHLRERAQRPHRGHRPRRLVARGDHPRRRRRARCSTTRPRSGTTPSTGTACRPPAAAPPPVSWATRSTRPSAPTTTSPSSSPRPPRPSSAPAGPGCVDDGGLKIQKTFNADLPLKHGVKALLTIDVWEHAYYIDYRNARPDYVGELPRPTWSTGTSWPRTWPADLTQRPAACRVSSSRAAPERRCVTRSSCLGSGSGRVQCGAARADVRDRAAELEERPTSGPGRRREFRGSLCGSSPVRGGMFVRGGSAAPLSQMIRAEPVDGYAERRDVPRRRRTSGCDRRRRPVGGRPSRRCGPRPRR